MSGGLQPRQAPPSSPVLQVAQFVLCAAAVGGIAWEAVEYAKQRWVAKASLNLKPWTDIFFHPDQSALFNYLGLCLCLALVGVLFYGLRVRPVADPVPEQARERSNLLDAVVFCSAVLVMTPLLKPALRVVLLTGIALHPFFWRRLRNVSGTLVDRCALAVAGLLVVLLCADPVALFVGPTRLMGEYPELFGETLVEGKFVNNRTFLERERPAGDDKEALRDPALRTGQPIDTAAPSSPAAAHGGYPPPVKAFHRMNRLEYSHQNMGRGQINHIGHVLNPINEVASGRPLRDVYVQYGVGNTWLMKFVMDVFGGPAYQTWYRCYILYIIYFLIFTYAAWVLFRQPLFVLGAVAGLAFAHFLTGFIGFVLAPGIIPSIHLLDAPLVIALIHFFKRMRVVSAVPVLLCTLAAMLLNPTFGLVTAAAAMAASLLFVLERAGRKLRWVLAMSVAFAAIVLLPTLLLKTRSDHVFRYFLLGYFSWEPPDLLPPLTILYLAVSYGFAFLLRESRNYLKYVYVYVFVYAQGLLLYFYWSGLTNHLPMAIPFLTLQFLLMIFYRRTDTGPAVRARPASLPARRRNRRDHPAARGRLQRQVVLFGTKVFLSELQDPQGLPMGPRQSTGVEHDGPCSLSGGGKACAAVQPTTQQRHLHYFQI